MSDFKLQYQTFHNFGYASNPDGSGTSVGNKWKRQLEGGRTIYTGHDVAYANELKSKRLNKGKRMLFRSLSSVADDIDGFLGPWAGYEGEEEEKIPAYESVLLSSLLDPLGRDDRVAEVLVREAQGEALRGIPSSLFSIPQDKDESSEEKPVSEEESRDKPWGEGIELAKTKSIFHGSSQVDYQVYPFPPLLSTPGP